MQTHASAGGASTLQKLARVFREKAAEDAGRMFKGAKKSRERLGVVNEILTYWRLEDADATLEDLEDALISSDFGPQTAFKIVDAVREQVRSGALRTPEDIKAALRDSVLSLVARPSGGSSELAFAPGSDAAGGGPTVYLIVGVNGGGKTTTIGKLAHRFTSRGARVLLAAGDTFRAAAGEQLRLWSQRSGAEVEAASAGARPDAVLFRAAQRAQREAFDLLLCDSSGRLHTDPGLMAELAKCRRSLASALPGAPHEVLLVLDGTTGVNMLAQAREFGASVGVTGLVLTKLDGTSRGGAVVSVIDQLGVPIKLVGVGEGLEDLQFFDPAAFVDALFPREREGEEPQGGGGEA
ncbi:Signal recognition particle receptor FtsY [Auxenochlorella protothecoides]|uniref:Signal recognition particle receptor FtsY n=1 Tax=Auxenochlorella protothecoides TaxID=3075 RepID=A0A087SM18_AUXPR|nr:Signal recognition particle receptor FtsY [Auxenochlorella protothecoides]KFM26772.1 Signal recognition particle receptor FtsY [Auxenochlorella protothecoides]